MAASWWRIFISCLLIQFRIFGCGTPAEDCINYFAVGIASGLITNQKLSSSTTYNSSNNFFHYAASQARLGIASFWCGSEKGTWKEDWVQVQFDEAENIAGIAVEKGLDDNANIGVLEEFYLQFSNDGISFWNQTGKSKKVIRKLATASQRTEYFWFDTVVAAKFVRIRASRLMLTSRSSRFCGRFELFGCSPSIRSIDNGFYMVGLSRGIIPDLQFSASSSFLHNPPYHARLNFRNSWCPTTNIDEWLQIDMGQALMVKGIATQGHYGRFSTDMVSVYVISFANNSGGPFLYKQNGSKNKTFIGNNQTSEDPVFSMIETSLVARYIRIHPLAGYRGGKVGKMCLRLELYASHPVCYANLMSTKRTKFYTVNSNVDSLTTSYVDIYSNVSWCSSKQINSRSPLEAESLGIDLGDYHLATGIAIAGSPSSDSWVTNVDVAFGLVPNEMETLEHALIGSRDRVNAAVNWFRSPKVVRYLQVKPIEFVGSSCLRIRVLGCLIVPTISYVPQVFSINVGSNHVTLEIETNGTKYVKAVLVKYICPDAALSLSCASWLSSIIPRKDLVNNSVKIKNLQPWTRYDMKLRFIFSSSQSLERNATNITTLEKASPGTEFGSTKDTSAMHSAIALISCSVGVMLVVITFILAKAFITKMKLRKRKKKSQIHMKMTKNRALANFLELNGTQVDSSIANDFEKLLRITREKRKKKGNLPPFEIKSSSYCKSQDISVHSAGRKSEDTKIIKSMMTKRNRVAVDDCDQLKNDRDDSCTFADKAIQSSFSD